MNRYKWACPRCGASDLYDFWCECGAPVIDCESHGETMDDPCHNAYCDECGWRGTLPQPSEKSEP